MIIEARGLRLRPFEAGWALERRTSPGLDKAARWKAYAYPHGLEHGLRMMLEEAVRRDERVADLDLATAAWRTIAADLVAGVRPE